MIKILNIRMPQPDSSLDQQSVHELPATDSLQSKQKTAWINFVLLTITCLMNSLIVQSLATINLEVTAYVSDVTPTKVSLCALCFMLIHPIITLPANYLLDHWGLKFGLSINALLVTLGVTLRCLVRDSFWFVIIGNALTACGSIFPVTIASKFASTWFPSEKRLFVVSILVYANAVSGEIGAVAAPYFVQPDLTPQDGLTALCYFLLLEALVISTTMLLSILFYRSHPTQRLHSHSKRQYLPKQQTKPISMRRHITSLASLTRSKIFLLGLLPTVAQISILNSFATEIQLLIAPFGFSSSDSGLLTAVTTISGLSGVLISSYIVRRMIRPLKLYQYIACMQIGSIIAFFVGLQLGLSWVLYAASGLFGACVYAILPALLQTCCQNLSEFGEASVNGILYATGQIISFIIILAQAPLYEDSSKLGASIGIGILGIKSLLVLLGLHFFIVHLSQRGQTLTEPIVSEN